jgi:hypothetical protein
MFRRFGIVAGSVLAVMALVVPVALGSGALAPLAASPVGTAFTYQGHLQQNGAPANGTCDLQLSLFDSATPTSQVGSTQTKTSVSVSNGLFTIPDLDFGNVFDGNARWLQVAVRCPGGSGGYTTLSPLVALTPTPYAIYALTAGTANSATTATTAGSATTATTAGSATNFSGSLAGDVTGTQGATVVGKLQGTTVSSTAPGANQVLQFAAGQWAPTTLASSGGLSEYAYIYNTAPTTIAIEADISFNSNGVIVGNITHTPGTSAITLGTAGNYKIAFSVSGTEPNQFAVFQNGVPVAGSIYGSGAGTQQNSGQVIVTASAGDVLTIRNHSSAAAVTIQTLTGGTQANANASILIEKLN